MSKQLLPVGLSEDVPLDVVATWEGKSGAVSVGLINYSPRDEVSVKLRIKGAVEPRSASGWRQRLENTGSGRGNIECRTGNVE